jgi:hypothetical protein
MRLSVRWQRAADAPFAACTCLRGSRVRKFYTAVVARLGTVGWTKPGARKKWRSTAGEAGAGVREVPLISKETEQKEAGR